nr:putative uncharacterized protein C5orf17 [Pan paniscus]
MLLLILLKQGQFCEHFEEKSLQGGVEGLATAGTGAARGASGAARGACGPAGVPGGRGLGGPCTRSSLLAPPRPSNEAYTLRASGCGGCTGYPSSDSPPALRWISRWALAAFPRGRARDLQPAMPEPPTPSVGSCAARASPMSAAPCSRAPSPIDHPRAEECGRAARDWQAAPPAAPVRDPLGEASWAPESGEDMENLYVQLKLQSVGTCFNHEELPSVLQWPQGEESGATSVTNKPGLSAMRKETDQQVGERKLTYCGDQVTLFTDQGKKRRKSDKVLPWWLGYLEG